MKKLVLLATVAGSAMLFSFRPAPASVWNVDKAHSKLGFTITHMMISDVEGSFKNFDAKITAQNDDFTDAVIEVTADVSTISTDNEKRDAHIKTPDFLDVSKFSTLTFKSTSFKKSGKNYKIKGNLTMHGVSKPVELDAVIRMGKNMKGEPVAGMKITGKLNRKNFEVGSATPAAMLSEEISIIANGEFSKN